MLPHAYLLICHYLFIIYNSPHFHPYPLVSHISLVIIMQKSFPYPQSPFPSVKTIPHCKYYLPPLLISLFPFKTHKTHYPKFLFSHIS